MSDNLGGYHAVINPDVPPGKLRVYPDEYALAFHDRYDLMAYVFWANLNPRLRALTYQCWIAWLPTRRAAEVTR